MIPAWRELISRTVEQANTGIQQAPPPVEQDPAGTRQAIALVEQACDPSEQDPGHAQQDLRDLEQANGPGT